MDPLVTVLQAVFRKRTLNSHWWSTPNQDQVFGLLSRSMRWVDLLLDPPDIRESLA